MTTPIVPDNETDLEFFARLDREYAAEKARLETEYPVYEPTAKDLAEYALWSANVQEHAIALTVWMDFYGEDEEKSTYYTA